MPYLKHPTLGNRHVDTELVAQSLEAAGWVRWPRTKDQKIGIKPVAEQTEPAPELVATVEVPITKEPKLNLLKLKAEKCRF